MKIKLAIIHFLICTVIIAQDKVAFTGTKNNVEYKAVFDGKDVYLTLRTELRETMQSMLRSGYTIYFDVNGKKKKKVNIQYPIKAKRPERGERRKNDKNGRQKGEYISKMIENLPKEANYTYFDSSEDFNLDMNDLGIIINYSYKNRAEGPMLEYKLKIPASKITKGTIDLSKLSIGVVSARQEQNRSQKQPSFGSGGNQRGGGQGRRSGGGGGQGGASRGGGGRAPQGKATTEVGYINFWFKLYPKKK